MNLSPHRLFGFGRRGLLEKGSFQKSPFSRESLENLEILGNPAIVQRFWENLDISELLEIFPVKRPLS